MVILYGIKNCDSVKKARVWLTENNVQFKFHDFRSDGLTESIIDNCVVFRLKDIKFILLYYDSYHWAPFQLQKLIY